METAKEIELEQMVRNQLNQELSSDEEEDPREQASRSSLRRPINDPFSGGSDSEDSDVMPSQVGQSPFPPKPVKAKSALQAAQEQMRWTREDSNEMEMLAKLQGNGMKDKKIRELASKYKTLNLVYQREKTMRRQLESQLASAMRTSQVQRERPPSADKLQKTINQSVKECGRCQQSQKKLMDMRVKNQSMKTQLNKINRLLSRELGEGFDVDAALGEENGWKGRQQKIQKLKGRVKELQEKLQNLGVGVGSSQVTGFSQSTKNAFANTQKTASLADNKRKELQNLKVQVQALRNQNELLQGKVKSVNSRKITLEAQLRDTKTDFEKKRQIFLQKSENDDKFISLLKQENEKLKREERVVTKVVYRDSKENNAQEPDAASKKEIAVLQREIESLRARIRNQEETQKQKVEDLKAQKAIDVRQVSGERKKQIEEEYLRSDKYLKKLSAQQEQEIYRTWKEGRKK